MVASKAWPESTTPFEEQELEILEHLAHCYEQQALPSVTYKDGFWMHRMKDCWIYQ